MTDADHCLDLGRYVSTDRHAARGMRPERRRRRPAPAHNTMVLTGCLAAGPDESTFKLTNAVPNAQASVAQPQEVGTSGDLAEYELRAEKNLDTAGVAPIRVETVYRASGRNHCAFGR
jgi:hypothetical protein